VGLEVSQTIVSEAVLMSKRANEKYFFTTKLTKNTKKKTELKKSLLRALCVLRGEFLYTLDE